MQPKLHATPDEADAALTKLGLTRRPLQEAVLAGLLARDACTANDPPFLPGIYQWGRTVRALREELERYPIELNRQGVPNRFCCDSR